MTTEPIADAEQGAPDLPPIDAPEPNPIIGEVARLNQEEIEGTPSEDVASEPAPTEASAQPAVAVTEPPPVEEPAPAPEVIQPPAPQYTPEQVQQLQQQAAEYQQQQNRQALQNQMVEYQRQLESQGVMADQAQQIAGQYAVSQQRLADTAREADQYGQYLQGQMLEAEMLAAKHNLGVGDLAELRKHQNPESMAAAAKQMADNRSRDAELTKLRPAQVPAQQFDNSQGEPSVAQNDASWLDRYNSGDRSPNSVAAARRATGLE